LNHHYHKCFSTTLENAEGAIKNRQSRETVNTRRRKTKQNHKTICVGHHYAQANSNNVNKTLVLLQTIEGKDEQNIVWMRTGDSERKYTTQTILHTYVGNINIVKDTLYSSSQP
jgi:hypothetical protein